MTHGFHQRVVNRHWLADLVARSSRE